MNFVQVLFINQPLAARSTRYRPPVSAHRDTHPGLTPGVLSLRLRPSRSPDMAHKNTICVWYDNGALEAATFYASLLPDSAVTAVHHAPGDYPMARKATC